jgi:phosphoribosylanthranilate isomerase
MSTRLKICGNRRPEDVQYLNEFLPDFAGVILSDGFGRSIVMDTFNKLRSCLDPGIRTVGVFVNEPLEEIVRCGYHETLSVIQLHGNEDAAYIQALRMVFGGEIWKAVRVQTAQDIAQADALPVDRLVLDSFSAQSVGGTGELAPWDIIAQNRPEKPFLLAGGITPENVCQAVADVQPWGVDCSSGVETDKCKDRLKIRALAENVKGGAPHGI